MKLHRHLFTIILLVACFTTVTGQEFGKNIRIGVVADSKDYELIPNLIELIRKESQEVMGSSYNIRMDEEHVLYSEWSNAKIKENILSHLQNDEIELIIGVGVLASAELARSGPYSKPVIAANVLNPQLQDLPLTLSNTTGVKNLNYVLTPFSPARDLEVFYSIYPFKNIALLMREEILSESDVVQKRVGAVFSNIDAEYEIIPVGSDVDAAISSISEDVDAVYYMALFYSDEQKQALYEGVNARKLPSFALFGRRELQLGALASIAPEFNFQRLARRIGVNIQKLSSGIDAEDIPVTMRFDESLALNMATAREIDFSPTWNVLSEAELLYEEVTEVSRTLTLEQAIEEALKANWSLIVAKRNVEAGERVVDEVRSTRLPQWDISGNVRIIDEDRAASSFGSQPQRLGTTSTGLSQVLYSEQLNSAVEIQRSSQRATIAEKDIIEMDVILAASEAYLNLLGVKTVERIQKENLLLTRKNLELARVRQAVGYSGPSDLYRWETQIAGDKINLNNAQAARKNAEINLNQILNRPLNELFQTVEVDLGDANLISNDPRLDQHVNNPASMAKFTDFMTEEGIRNLPELQQLDALIEAQRRQMLFTKRNFYQPTVGLDAGFDYLFYRGGSGTDPLDLSGIGAPPISSPDDVLWSIGVGASLPIFTGGKRSAQYQRASIELAALEAERSNLVNVLEQRIRSNMEFVGASYANIELSQNAQTASEKNLNLVQDSYSKGVVSIIQLIDAQNAAIASSQSAANAGYVFIIDLINVERAIGNFYTISTTQERDQYFQRLEEFVQSQE